MTDTPESENNLHRLATAAAWRVALSDAGLESSLDFELWLASDKANEAAWAQVQAPWNHIAQSATAPESLAARGAALQYVRREQRRRMVSRNWRGLRIAASIAAVVLVSAVGVGAWDATRADVYQTALGERRSLTLADGSNVILDSDALLKVRYLKDRRELELVRGQAHFTVAHDMSRPFSVHARDRVVVATGTSFNVDLLGPRVIVTLIEGKVNIMKTAPTSWTDSWCQPQRTLVARLGAGQQFVAMNSASGSAAAGPPIERVTTASLERATAWESGQLVFDNEALGAVAERVGRYANTPLRASGPAANLRISGVFNIGDVTAFLDAVQHMQPVHVEHSNGQIVLKLNTP